MKNQTFAIMLFAALLIGALLGWFIKPIEKIPVMVSHIDTVFVKGDSISIIKTKYIYNTITDTVIKKTFVNNPVTITDSTGGFEKNIFYGVKHSITLGDSVKSDWAIDLLPIETHIIDSVFVPHIVEIAPAWYMNNWFYTTLSAIAILILHIVYK